MQDGAQKKPEVPVANRFTDGSGTVYNVGAFLGGGVEGKTFLGTVVSLGKNADPRLQVGTEVAVKQQPITVTGNAQEHIDGLNREIAILAKEGSFFGSGQVETQDKPFLLMAIPVIKGKTLRDRLYDIDDNEMDQKNSYKAKKDISPQDKASWCYQILRDYAAQHMLSLLHVDVKPDNVLVTDDGKVKVIDWGNSWDRDKSEAHPKDFQSPGALYAAPENYDDVMDAKDRKCSLKADEYAIGMMLASMWTQSFYERDADLHAFAGNDALGARLTLNDILGPNAQKPADMPEDLFKIIRHLTAVNPNNRPEGIPFADGLRESTNPILHEIVQANARLERVAKEVVASINVDDFREMARANGKKALSDFDVQVQAGTQPPNPLANFSLLQDYIDKLRAIASEHASTLPARKNQIARLEKAYNDVLGEMINSGNPHFKKIAEKANNLEGTPSAKMQQVLKDYKKIAPEIIQDGLKTASLEGEIYLRLNSILKNEKDPILLRIALADLYTQVKSLSAIDKDHKKQYQPIESHLNKILAKLDNARTMEARKLQGHPPAQPQQTVRARRKRSYMSRARNFIKALRIVEADPVKKVQIARQLASQIPMQQQNQASNTPTSSATTVQPKAIEPAKMQDMQIVPVQRAQDMQMVSVASLETMLDGKKEEKAQQQNEASFNPLSLDIGSASPRLFQLSKGAAALNTKRPGVGEIAISALISGLRHVEPRLPNISINTLNSIAQTVQSQIGANLTPQTKKALDAIDNKENKPEEPEKKKQNTLGS